MKLSIASYLKPFILILTFALLFSCGDKATKAEENSILKVSVYQVEKTASNTLFEVSGTVEAEKNANISTRLMGEVLKVSVKIGDKVRQGDLLLSINSADLKAKKAQVKAQISQANSAFINAKKDYERFTQLFKEKSATQKELDNITTNFEQAKAGLEAAKQMQNEVGANLAYADIKAPFDGIITGKFINNGDLANPGIPLLSMENNSNYLVKTYVNENQIGQIKNGDKVHVVIKSSNQQLMGIVSEISISSKDSGGLYLVKIKLSKPEKVYSGMFASIIFSNSETKNASLFIPKSTLIYQGQLTGIYTVSMQNTAILRWLRLGKIEGNQVEVLSGLTADEKIITQADGVLFNGASVKIN